MTTSPAVRAPLLCETVTIPSEGSLASGEASHEELDKETPPLSDEVAYGCQLPPDIESGYYVLENMPNIQPDNSASGIKAVVNQRAHYNCNLGYVLTGTTGSATLQCIESGDWSPRIPPTCSKILPGVPQTKTNFTLILSPERSFRLDGGCLFFCHSYTAMVHHVIEITDSEKHHDTKQLSEELCTVKGLEVNRSPQDPMFMVSNPAGVDR
uniref:Sushi domain-containing protein n=1 Tax=Timema douglasi TaxID=61478 RepID=A0A7R8VIR0_TIMDO|nr:unnamed protein product [Timema douglasi]